MRAGLFVGLATLLIAFAPSAAANDILRVGPGGPCVCTWKVPWISNSALDIAYAKQDRYGVLIAQGHDQDGNPYSEYMGIDLETLPVAPPVDVECVMEHVMVLLEVESRSSFDPVDVLERCTAL